MAGQIDFITVPEAAEQLGYTVQHTRLLLRQNKLRGDKLGRDWIVVKEAVTEYNLRKSSIPLLTPLSKKGRPSIGERKQGSYSYYRQGSKTG